MKSSVFCKGGGQIELQEAEPEVKDLSPVLFEDSPSSSPCLLGSDGVAATAGGGAFEVFGTSVEEAVREMRFRIEQKTMLTASAGKGKTTLKHHPQSIFLFNLSSTGELKNILSLSFLPSPSPLLYFSK